MMNKLFLLLAFLIPGILKAQLAGNSLQIKDYGNFIKVPDSLSTSLNNDMTLEAWVFYNCENSTAASTIISKGSCGNTASYRLDLIGGAIRFTKWRNSSWSTINCSAGTQGIFQTVTKTVPFNVWSHIAVTIDDTTVQLYMNGMQVPINFTTGPNTVGFKPSTEAIRIGAFYVDGTSYTKITGNIDDVRIWHKAKTQTEIQNEMNIELAGNEPNLFAYWKLNETGLGAGLVAANSAISTGTNYNGITVGSSSNLFFIDTDSLPNSIPNCDPLLWLKADKGVSYNANKEVSLWQDQSQLGNDVTVTTAAQKPSYKTNEINNKPIVRFDGLNDFLATPTINLTAVNKIEVFYVAKSRKEGYIISHNSDPTVANAFSVIENNMNGTNGHSAILNGNGTAQVSCKTVVTDSCYHTMNIQFDKSLTGLNQVKIFGNQTLLANTNGVMVGPEMTNALSSAPLYIGGSPLVALPQFGGDLAELIVYNKILTSSERTQIYTYLNNKYNGNNLSTQFTTSTIFTTFSDEITDDKEWRHSFNSSQPQQVLTSVRSDCLTFDDRIDSVFVEANAISYGSNYFMRRHFVIHPSTEYNGTKRVRLYYSLADFNNLQNFIPSLSSHTQLSVIQYDGLNEDGLYDPTGGNISFISPSQITYGTAYGLHYLEFDVTHFSEFWIQVGSFPMPIHELNFSVTTLNQIHQLSWNCKGYEDIVSYSVLESGDNKNYTIIQRIASTESTSMYKTTTSPSSSPFQYFIIEAEDIHGAKYRSKTHMVANKNNTYQLEANYTNYSVNIISNRAEGKIQIYSMNGQKLLEAEHHISIDKQRLASGLYFAFLVEMGMVQHSLKFAVY